MIATVAPADLRPGDRVLVNGGWWTFVPPVVLSRTGRRRLTIVHERDEITIYRTDSDRLTIDRGEP